MRIYVESSFDGRFKSAIQANRWYMILILLILLPGPVLAEKHNPAVNQSLHAGSIAQHDQQKNRTEPDPPRYALDPESAPTPGFGVQPIHDNALMATFLVDRFEYQSREGNDTLLWDVQAWAGRDYNKLWFKSEGTRLIDADEFEEVATELFYSRNIATFWDLQAGLRHDFKPDPDRTFAAFGVQGLAPYWFEVEATGYLSEDGDASAAVAAEYDLLLSQRLILQPRLEFGLSLQDVPEYETWQGLTDLTLGLRLRYEIRREFAPYIGVSWTSAVGETAARLEDRGEDITAASFVAGIKLWF